MLVSSTNSLEKPKKVGQGKFPRPSKEGGVKDRIPDTNATYFYTTFPYINFGHYKCPNSPDADIFPRVSIFLNKVTLVYTFLVFHYTLHDLDPVCLTEFVP
jgi:hypothetical protein